MKKQEVYGIATKMIKIITQKILNHLNSSEG